MRALPLTIGPIHFVGIGGIGMSGIAEVLHNLGYQVQGSDIAEGYNVARLRAAGIPVAVGHAAENLGGAAGRRRLHRGEEGQSGGPGGARAADPGGAPGRDAGRADAAEMVDRGRRHAWQDHHHQPDRLRAGSRARSIRP